MQSPLYLQVEAFYLTLEQTSRLAEHKVVGPGSKYFPQGSLGVIISGATSISTS